MIFMHKESGELLEVWTAPHVDTFMATTRLETYFIGEIIQELRDNFEFLGVL